jgi:toxin YoeB
MNYHLNLTKDALEDIENLKKAGDKTILRKLAILLKELTEHPRVGTGQPEELKHNYSGCWSRRLSIKHRIIYRIQDNQYTVIILYIGGHYADK